MDLQEDLRQRWLPSAEQMARADALLSTGNHPDGVFTVHLLVNKTFGFWTADVEVVPVDGVFVDREAAFLYAIYSARHHHERTGAQVMAGYAWHPEIGQAAVWDLIGSECPEGGYSKKDTEMNDVTARERVVLGLIGAHLSEVRNDPEFGAKTSKGTGLRYAETHLAELYEQTIRALELDECE